MKRTLFLVCAISASILSAGAGNAGTVTLSTTVSSSLRGQKAMIGPNYGNYTILPDTDISSGRLIAENGVAFGPNAQAPTRYRVGLLTAANDASNATLDFGFNVYPAGTGTINISPNRLAPVEVNGDAGVVNVFADAVTLRANNLSKLKLWADGAVPYVGVYGYVLFFKDSTENSPWFRGQISVEPGSAPGLGGTLTIQANSYNVLPQLSGGSNLNIISYAENPTATRAINLSCMGGGVNAINLACTGSQSNSDVINLSCDELKTTATTFTGFEACSDVTLKKDIITIPNALERVCNLRGVNFRWKKDKDGPLNMGLIAQEVEPVFPEVVYTHNDKKYIRYPELVGALVEAIKAQQKEIEELKKEVRLIKGK